MIPCCREHANKTLFSEDEWGGAGGGGAFIRERAFIRIYLVLSHVVFYFCFSQLPWLKVTADQEAIS